jgi:hypothetical protein
VTSLAHISADSLIEEPILTRWRSMPQPPAVTIRPFEGLYAGRRWVVDYCCNTIHIDWELDSPQATAALDEALNEVARRDRERNVFPEYDLVAQAERVLAAEAA